MFIKILDHSTFKDLRVKCFNLIKYLHLNHLLFPLASNLFDKNKYQYKGNFFFRGSIQIINW